MKMPTPYRNSDERRTWIEASFKDRFGSAARLAARSPGRVDLMGSHTDYNAGSVLTLAIDRDTWVFAAPHDQDIVQLVSLNLNDSCCFAIGDTQKVDGWGQYVQGVVKTLEKAGYPISGFSAVVHGTIPIGSGLSSSASLEAATATLLEQLGSFSVPDIKKARLCQQAENEWVGVNCGILDQYSSILGKAGSALLLDCRSLTHQFASIPMDLTPVICNTHAPRQLADSEYGLRRQQCEEAAAFFKTIDSNLSSLRDVSLERFNQYRAQLTEVVQKRAQFVIEENTRVADVSSALQSANQAQIGQLMADSFYGARDLYEISVPEMQAMFDAMSQASGCIGCRQAGAGFGGCMIALVEIELVKAFEEEVIRAYQNSTGITPEVYPVQTANGAEAISVSRP